MKMAIQEITIPAGSGYLEFRPGTRIWEVEVADQGGRHHFACKSGEEVEPLCVQLLADWGFR